MSCDVIVVYYPRHYLPTARPSMVKGQDAAKPRARSTEPLSLCVALVVDTGARSTKK